MADLIMLVDTAVTVPVNLLPLLDDTDFKTRETAVAYNAAGMDLVWNFVTAAGVITQTAVTPTTAGDYDWTHVGDGIYKIEIPASGGASINNDTEGFGWFSGVVTGVLPFRGPVVQFSPANVVNSLVPGTDKLEVDVAQFGGTNLTATGGRPEVNTTHAAGTAWNSGAIGASTLAADTIAASKIAADAITAAKIADGAIDAATFAAGAINAAAIATDAITADKIAADAIGSSELAATAVTEIQSGLSTLDAAGIRTAVGLASANLDTQLSTIAGYIDTEVASVLSAVDTEVGAIKAKTDQLTFTVANQVDANALAISGSTEAADRIERSALGIITGTCDTGGSTTSIVASALSPASGVNDQFNGRIIIFDKDTTTAALRGQATDITDFVHATQTFTVTALTTAPASGDTFTIT